MKQTYTFDDAQIRWISRAAHTRFERWDNAADTYGQNNRYTSHVAGVAGEVAARLYLDLPGILADDDEPDLIYNGQEYEVKCWYAPHWTELGRCLTPKHLDLYEARGIAGVIWTSHDYTSATVHGYSTLGDIAAKPITYTGSLEIPNHQININEMRRIEHLRKDK